MKKVLFISYFFPPLGGGGVIRVAKFVKYLSRFSYQPRVLTVKKGFYPIKDESLLSELPPEVKIDRVSYFEPAFWFNNRYWHYLLKILYLFFLIPDRQILWFLPAFIKAYKIIKKEHIEIIFTSSLAYSDHLIALTLQKTTGVKWVADFRDEWTTNPGVRFATPLHRFLAKKMELKIIKSADHIISVSEPITKYFRHLSGNRQAFSTITNGFDREDLPVNQHFIKNKYCQITYVGTLYGKGNDVADSFKRVIQELHIKDLKVVFWGQEKKVTHKEAVQIMAESDILLLILSSDFRPGVYTGKLFEYLAVRRPILALAGRETAAAKLIDKIKAGEVADPLDKEEIKAKILKMYYAWQKGELKIPKVNINQFDRFNLTAKLARLFNGLLASFKDKKNSGKNSFKKRKIRICFIGNLQSPQNRILVDYFEKRNYEIHFITYKKAKFKGIKIYLIPQQEMTSRSNFPFLFKAIFDRIAAVKKIKKLITEIKPDILHGQSLIFSGIWAELSGFHPLVLTLWGSEVMLFEKYYLPIKYLIKRTLKKADFITGVSDAMRDKAKKIGMESRFMKIHFGIDLKIFKKRDASRLREKLKIGSPTDEEKIIFCPRSIAAIYNIDILIQAFKVIADQQKVKLILLGQNTHQDYLTKIKAMVSSFNLDDKVLFLPRVKNQEMVGYYNIADVVVSLATSDGCAMSFLEAMACETKIVLSNVEFVPEWHHNKNFWVVPIRNTKATVIAIKEALATSSKEFEKIGRNNRQMIADQAEINSNFGRLDMLYKQLLEETKNTEIIVGRKIR